MVKERKYKNKSEYLKHPYISNYFISTYELIPTYFLFTIIISMLAGEYPVFLASFDLAACSLLVLFIFIIKPLIFTGKIPAYYRKDYYKVNLILWLTKHLIFASVIRVTTFMTILFLNYKLSNTKYKIDIYRSTFMRYISDFDSMAVALVFCLIAMYFIFYSEKFVSVKNYSNGVVDVMRKRNLEHIHAAPIFTRDLEKEYEISQLGDILYDYSEIKSEISKNNETIRNDEIYTNSIVENVKEAENEKSIEIKQIRRKGRI